MKASDCIDNEIGKRFEGRLLTSQLHQSRAAKVPAIRRTAAIMATPQRRQRAHDLRPIFSAFVSAEVVFVLAASPVDLLYSLISLPPLLYFCTIEGPGS